MNGVDTQRICRATAFCPVIDGLVARTLQDSTDRQHDTLGHVCIVLGDWRESIMAVRLFENGRLPSSQPHTRAVHGKGHHIELQLFACVCVCASVCACECACACVCACVCVAISRQYNSRDNVISATRRAPRRQVQKGTLSSLFPRSSLSLSLSGRATIDLSSHCSLFSSYFPPQLFSSFCFSSGAVLGPLCDPFRVIHQGKPKKSNRAVYRAAASSCVH